MTSGEVPSVADAGRRRDALEQQWGPWERRVLPRLLDDVARRWPDRPMVLTDESTVTYAQMQQWTRQLARGLIAHGVQPGDNVAMVLPNWPETVALRFAIARVGAVAVPLNFLLQAEELALVLAQARVSVVVTMDEFRTIDALAALDRIVPGWDRGRRVPTLPHLRLVVTVPKSGRPPRAGTETLDDLRLDPGGRLDEELRTRESDLHPDDTATIFFTSGTTGAAKGVLSTHDMEIRSAYGSAYTRAFEDGRRILFALPLHHVFAYIEGLLAALFVGGCVILQDAFDPHETLRAVGRHQAGEALFVPTMSLAVVEAAEDDDADLSSLHSVMSAAQSAPARLWMALEKQLGLEQLVTAYGMTETSAATTFTRPGDPMDHLVGTVGRAKDGGVAGDASLGGRLVEYQAVDLGGHLLPPGEEGELVARGPIVSAGYYDKVQETVSARLPGGWLRSGDLGRVREDGYVELTGRRKELYKCGGEMVMPTEVEARIDRRSDVAQAHVVGVPDARMGEVGCAWVVPAGDDTPDAKELIEYCAQELARFKVPAYVLFTTAAELPLTASGKVQKFRLAERARERLGL